MRPVKAKRPYSDRAGYLREYMRGYMQHRLAGQARSSGHARMLLASGYDIGQKELRDGSGILMWPTRIRESETPYSDGNREIDAAGKRRGERPPMLQGSGMASSHRRKHSSSPQREPARRGPKIAVEPRKFERRRAARG